MAGLAPAAQAAVVFSDNFNAESQGLNYTGFSNWTVSGGTVDVIGTSFFQFLPTTYGNYVDLDGSTGNAGILSTTQSFAAGTYTLSFILAGNHRNAANESVTVSLGDFSQTISGLGQSAITAQTITFTTTGGQLKFDHAGGDNIGLLLDNVQLSSAVPEPATWAMMLVGFAGLGFAARRRAVAAA